jgi:c-di-GMP-related signal transduction protein
MKIKMSEFKLRAIQGIGGLIDTYFSGNSISERLMNATVKIIVNQNVDKYDDIINLFADKDGYIDTDMMIREYGKAFGSDKVILDIRDFVDNDVVRGVLPNKAIAIKIDDLASIFEDS